MNYHHSLLVVDVCTHCSDCSGLCVQRIQCFLTLSILLFEHHFINHGYSISLGGLDLMVTKNDAAQHWEIDPLLWQKISNIIQSCQIKSDSTAHRRLLYAFLLDIVLTSNSESLKTHVLDRWCSFGRMRRNMDGISLENHYHTLVADDNCSDCIGPRDQQTLWPLRFCLLFVADFFSQQTYLMNVQGVPCNFFRNGGRHFWTMGPLLCRKTSNKIKRCIVQSASTVYSSLFCALLIEIVFTFNIEPLKIFVLDRWCLGEKIIRNLNRNSLRIDCHILWVVAISTHGIACMELCDQHTSWFRLFCCFLLENIVCYLSYPIKVPGSPSNFFGKGERQQCTVHQSLWKEISNKIQRCNLTSANTVYRSLFCAFLIHIVHTSNSDSLKTHVLDRWCSDRGMRRNVDGIRFVKPFHAILAFDLILSIDLGIKHPLSEPLLLTLCLDDILPLGTRRIGEAQNPGPSGKYVNIAAINPTSLANKQDEFAILAQTHDVHIIAAAETTATIETQQSFSRVVQKHGYHAIWSPPVIPQKTRLDGQASRRGRVGGVALFSRFPCRKSWDNLPKPWDTSTRIVHSLVQLGQLWVQIFVLYGLAMPNKGAKEFTEELLQQAGEKSKCLPFPTIFIGDFNQDIHILSSFQWLSELGFRSLQQIYGDKYQIEMPYTCREATKPDTALISPELIPLVDSITVLKTGLFDTHDPVLFQLRIPEQQLFRQKILLPQTWNEFPIKK